MKTATTLLFVALLAAAPFATVQAATPAASATTATTLHLPLSGEKSVEKSRVQKRKQTLRRRKRMFSF